MRKCQQTKNCMEFVYESGNHHTDLYRCTNCDAAAISVKINRINSFTISFFCENPDCTN